STGDHQHHARLGHPLVEHRRRLRCGQTVIHHDLDPPPGTPPRLGPRVHPPAPHAPRVAPPRRSHRHLPLLRRAVLPAVPLPAVAGPAHRDLPPASPAVEQSLAPVLDRPRTRPRAPLDFPEPSPYPPAVA